MTQYRKMAQQHLIRENPQELQRLKREGKLQTFLENVDEVFNDQEKTIVEQMVNKDESDFLKRVQQANMAQMAASFLVVLASQNAGIRESCNKQWTAFPLGIIIST